MIEPRKYKSAQDDGIDAPEVNTCEREWLVFMSCPGVYEPGMLYKVQAVTREARVSLRRREYGHTNAINGGGQMERGSRMLA